MHYSISCAQLMTDNCPHFQATKMPSFISGTKITRQPLVLYSKSSPSAWAIPLQLSLQNKGVMGPWGQAFVPHTHCNIVQMEGYTGYCKSPTTLSHESREEMTVAAPECSLGHFHWWSINNIHVIKNFFLGLSLNLSSFNLKPLQ